MGKWIEPIRYWLYHCEAVRVENHAHIGHFFFGKRILIVGKYYYSLWEK